MADYYPLLARALEALPNSSPAMRKAVYDRARNALTAQLRSLDPPVSEADIAVEQKALDSAIERLETGLAAAKPAPEPEPKPAPPTTPAREPEPAPPTTPAQEPKPPPPAAPAAPAPEPEPLPEAAPMPAAVPLNTQPAVEAKPAAAEPSRKQPEPEKPAEPKPRTEFVAFVPPPRKKAADPTPAADPEVPSVPEPSNANSPAPSPVPIPTVPIENGASRRPKIDVVAPAANKSRAVRNVFVGGVLALVIGAIAVAAFLLRDEPSSLTQNAEGDGQAQVERSEQKFGDRVDGPRSDEGNRPPVATPAAPEVTVAQRGILYEENTANPQAEPRTTGGRVVWRLEPINGEQGQPLQNAVRATADFSEAGLLLTMTIRKNIDATLPASHTIELDFTMSGSAASQIVQEIGLLQLKDDQNARGTTISGLPVRVRDNLFLIGLSNLPDDITRNRDLLLQRSWIDLGFKFRSGQRGVLAIEKGTSGAQVLQSAFNLWRN